MGLSSLPDRLGRKAFFVTRNSAERDMAARGRIGGYRLRATHDPQQYTLPARRAFLNRFTPDDTGLSDEERQARAQAALKAHMMRLARLSALARQNRNKKGGA